MRHASSRQCPSAGSGRWAARPSRRRSPSGVCCESPSNGIRSSSRMRGAARERRPVSNPPSDSIRRIRGGIRALRSAGGGAVTGRARGGRGAEASAMARRQRAAMRLPRDQAGRSRQTALLSRPAPNDRPGVPTFAPGIALSVRELWTEHVDSPSSPGTDDHHGMSERVHCSHGHTYVGQDSPSARRRWQQHSLRPQPHATMACCMAQSAAAPRDDTPILS